MIRLLSGRPVGPLAAALVLLPSLVAQAQRPPSPAASGGARSAPAEAATAPAPPAAAPGSAAITPKRLSATVYVRDPSGTELRRVQADTQSPNARAECAFIQGGPAPNTLSLAVGTRGELVLQAQIADAKNKPSLHGVLLTLMDSNPESVSTLEFDAGACRLESAKFDGQSGDFDVRCDDAGRGLRAQRKVEMKIHVEGCPVMAAPPAGPMQK